MDEDAGAVGTPQGLRPASARREERGREGAEGARGLAEGTATLLQKGLDLSFGHTPVQFSKINLLGSELSEHAISSLVLSVEKILYLDLRGNKLNAAFGWRLVKAMKRRYLFLEFCNGVPLKKVKDNEIESLNLSSFESHHGMYGIEVVGAIFLAHFLRINSSLKLLNFKRNDVEKDGAKALAQSLLNNPQCVIRTVNAMGPLTPTKPGIDFSLFRTMQLTQIQVSKRLLDDDDFVFLEEWLRKYDCVTDLDISDNLIWKDGIRKLARYIKDTNTLKKLNCTGLPVDLEGASQIAQAVVQNQTLEVAGIPLGPCDDNPDRQLMLQHLGVGLAAHPSINFIATNKPGGLDWVKLGDVRSGSVLEWPPARSGAWPDAQMAVYMWFLQAIRAPVEKLEFGPGGRPLVEYPDPTKGARAALWPALPPLVRELGRTLVSCSVAFPRGYGPKAMELMRNLTTCGALRTLHLLGYASAVFQDSHLPPEWSQVGAAPRWLLEDRLKKSRVHWQALYGLLNSSTMQHLEAFNDIPLGGSLRDQPDLTCLLLLQCLPGVAASLAQDAGPSREPRLVANLQAEADVEAFCDVLRLLSRTPLLVELKFTDKSVEVVKAQQHRLVGPLSGATSFEGMPRFNHAIVLKNNQVSEQLLQAVDPQAALREFCYENLTTVLPALFSAFCARDRPLQVERIRVEPKWMPHNKVRKRFDERERNFLEGIHAALSRSERFVEVNSESHGIVPKAQIVGMAPEEFADMMTGVSVEDPQPAEQHMPRTPWRCFSSYRRFLAPPDPHEEPLFLPLPLDDEAAADLRLRRLSLCMCNLRARLEKAARPDEWPASSRPLWFGAGRFVRPGDWNEGEPMPAEEVEVEDLADEDRHTRFHWQPFGIGTAKAAAMVASRMDSEEPPFADTLLHESLRSLLSEASSLTSLDLRGNGLTRDDADLVLKLVESQETLLSLNGIPVAVDEAAQCQSLVLDGAGVDKAAGAGHDDSYDFEEPEGELYSREAMQADKVRLDEGDGYMFLHLVTPQYFPQLSAVALRQLEIPSDNTLAHITDALLNLPAIRRLQLQDLKLSGRGASLLLQAVAELAPRIDDLNGLPLARLVQMRDAGDGSSMELPAGVDWNDFPLGAMARLNLWQVATFPPAPADGDGPLKLKGHSITDVGLRGLCVMLRHFAGQAPGAGPRGGSAFHLTRIDLSGNLQITDATVADLCHTLQHPSMGGNLRNSLRELSVRSCMRLRSRSAYELQNFVHHVREVMRDGAAAGAGLQMINGVDLEALHTAGRAVGASGRASGQPMMVRAFVEAEDSQQGPKAKLAALSECDIHFFAAVMHMYSSIQYCHMHVVIPRGVLQPEENIAEGYVAWGHAGAGGDDSPFTQAHAVTNDSPFPPPQSASKHVAQLVQAHLDAARRLFEAAPISTQLRLSVAPCIPGCEDILAEGEPRVLAVVPGTERPGGESSAFNRVKQRLHQKAAKRRRDRHVQPARPLYVNNINSQRLHCCFRTLYGKGSVYGKDEAELEHGDIISDSQGAVTLPGEVDFSQAFAVATSVDLQHLDLSPVHFATLPRVVEMPVLTHINLNHNRLGDSGIELLFRSLVDAGSNVMHVSVASNGIGDEGATTIAVCLASLPRLTSIELCDNFIQERGSIALAAAIGGEPAADEDGEEAAPVGPLPVLSVDLRGNRSRELGARRWAEVICSHPDLKFLCLAQNELGMCTKEYFLDLVCAAVEAPCLSVLDLQDNFPQPDTFGAVGPPPADVIEELLPELPPGEFDPKEVRQAVFIRRHRGGAAPEKKGRQPQQGQLNATAARPVVQQSAAGAGA